VKDRGPSWLLLGCYTDEGELIYAGRVGMGMPVKVRADLRRRLDPLARKTSPLVVLRLAGKAGVSLSFITLEDTEL
jgi:ATP-dependent DNA ligase